MHNKSNAAAQTNAMPSISRTDTKSLKMLYPRAWNMTSRELHDDPDARLDCMQERVKDKQTLTTFRNAILYNRHLFVGRQVLVLNCGVDFLLTLWTLKTGAAHVYGVDTSHAIEYLRSMLCANNLNDKVTLIQGRVEDIKLPVEKVDIIISNWMGYSLMIDSKCEALINARDKWLKETGIIFPDEVQLYAVGVESSKSKNEHVDWWRDVNGFNMNSIRNQVLKEPMYHSVEEQQLLTNPVKVWSIDLYTVKPKELQFRTPFTVKINRCGCLEGMLTFFDVNFSKSHTPIAFSTSPWSQQTNWLQTVFYFDEPITVNLADTLFCGMHMHPVVDNTNTKSYSVLMEVYTGDPGNLSQVACMTWRKRSRQCVLNESSNPRFLLEKPKDNGVKETVTTKSTSPVPKQNKQKRSEKKKRLTKKVSASIFFN